MKSLEDFLEKAKKIHGDTYDYSLVKYVLDSNEKIKIICPVHDIFEQRVKTHVKNIKPYGCWKCARIRNNLKLTLTLEEFETKCNIKHNGKYDYSLVEYKGNRFEVNIICPIHKVFPQNAGAHLRGQGCGECAKENLKLHHQMYPKSWSYSTWEQKGLNSKHFDSFKCYIIKCWNNDESEVFYKIGKTFTTMQLRFPKQKSMPYNYEVVNIQVGTAIYISKLENILKKLNRNYKYLPLKKFGGMYECFSEIDINILNNL